ncbi:minor capsid protein [Paenisporosarcina sp. TG-14]|uniref:minor capsid protein n=1 Tax=Paenisporosarcina sp. TG-14 TaxID=1231057 RepID=UPI00037BCC68|nr:minor capsid protein [Paenisporosarcina sp. TG-14]
MKVKVNMDYGALRSKMVNATNKTQSILDLQVLKDSNKFAPQDLSELKKSSIRTSKIGTGELIWETPYARKLYYNPQYKFSKDKNPLAGGLWFERAKAEKKKVWIVVAKAAFKANL